MKSPRVKGQVASMDIIISAIILLLLLSVIIVLLNKVTDNNKSKVIYGGQVFTNIENLNTFLDGQKIDEGELNTFVIQNIDLVEEDILMGTDIFSPQQHDVCLFFMNASTPVQINGADTKGHGQCTTNNPCKGYEQSYIFAKPVLLKHELVTMYVAVCELLL